MLYIKSFSNYTEFQEIFGVRVFGEEKARKNKILLALLKDKAVHKRAIESGDFTLLSIKNMVDLKNICIKKLHESGAKSSKLRYEVNLLGVLLQRHLFPRQLERHL